jgi:hypothetical protein
MIGILRNLYNTTSANILAITLKHKHKEIYDWVISSTDDNFLTFNERVFWLLNPSNIICENNKRLKYVAKRKEYGFCGGPNTCECHKAEIKDRTSKTTVFGTEDFLEKRKETWTEKYGTDNPQKLQEYKDSATERNTGKVHTKGKRLEYVADGYNKVIARLKDEFIPLFTVDEYLGSNRKNVYKWQCVKCSKIVDSHIDYETVPRCTICNPKEVSTPEHELREYLDSFNIAYECNVTNIIPPLELDIFVPTLNVAIEHNGTYWHSSKKKDKNYHINKYNICKEKGIHLIQIFGDQWKNKQDIVKARLKNVLGVDTKIYARKCDIKVITGKESKLFLDEHHIQGWVSSSIKLGLFFNDNLVAVMTFGKPRYGNLQSYELLRFCSINTIVGGADKLFKYFLRNYKPDTVVSYADRCWSAGNLYKKLGFKDVTEDKNNIGYFYIKNDTRINRLAYTKKKLVSLGFDSEKTAEEILESEGFLLIHTCGNYKFIYDNNRLT